MASTILDPIAVKLQAKIAATTVTIGGQAKALKGYLWEPRDFDKLPAGAVGPPNITRVGAEEAEFQLGSDTWTIEYPVSLYFDLSEATASQAQAVEGVEHFIAQVDADQQLTGSVVDCKVTRSEVFVEQSRSRPLLGYECTVEVLKFVGY